MKNSNSRLLKIVSYSSITLAGLLLYVNSGVMETSTTPSCIKVFKLNDRPEADYKLVNGSGAHLEDKQNNSRELQEAVKAGAELLADPNNCGVMIRISEGHWFFEPRVAGDNVILRVPHLPKFGNKVLAVSGVGANLAKIHIGLNQTFVRNQGAINNFKLSDFSLIQVIPSTFELKAKDRFGNTVTTTYTHGLKTTQGKVIREAANYIEVELFPGFPHPIALDSFTRGECVPSLDENAQGALACEQKYLKRFALDANNTPYFPFQPIRTYPIPANPRPNNYRVAYTGVENVSPDGRVVRVYVNNISPTTGKRVFVQDDLVAFKSKHGGLMLYLFDCTHLAPGECQGLTFSGLSFLYEARGVIRDVDSVSVLNNRIERTPAISGNLPALATTAGGFQINGGKDHEVRDNVMIALGDDGIAFFDILGSPDSTKITGNRIEDSWNRGIYIRSSRAGDSVTVTSDNCISERGCARVDSGGNKIEFKMFLFQKPALEAPLFLRTFIDYAGAEEDEG